MALRMKKFTKFLLVILASLFVIFACGSSMGVELFRDGKGSVTVSVKKERVVDFAPDRASFEEYFNDYVKAINSASGQVTALDVKKYSETDTHYRVTLKTRRIDKIKGIGKLLYGDMDGFLKTSDQKDELNYGYKGFIPTVMKSYPDGTATTYFTRYDSYVYERDENGGIKYKTDENGDFLLDENGEKQPNYKKKDTVKIENNFVMKAKTVDSGKEIKNFSALEKEFSKNTKDRIVFFRLVDFLVDEITLELPGNVKYVSFMENNATNEKVETVSVSGKRVTVKAVQMNFATKDKIYEGKDDGAGECTKNIFYGYFVYEEGISPWAIAGIVAGVGGLGTLLFFGIFKGGFKRFFKGKVWKAMLRYKLLYVLIIPALVLLILFRYMPMLWLTAGFMDYDLFEGLGSEWIGLHYFKGVLFATNTSEMYRIFRNTIFISLIRILSNLPVILFLAILINSIKNKKGRTVFQAISFIPYFLSWVSVGGIFNALLDSNYGMINRVFGLDINWYGYAEPWWAILSVSSLWKGMGWSTLIYISAMCNIDGELYEACALDGGGKLRQVFTVTLPGIMNIICLQLILDVSNIMRDNYEQILAMTNGQVTGALQETVDVVGRIAYTALNKGNFGSATAIGLIQGVIGSGLVLITNKIVKKTENEGII